MGDPDVRWVQRLNHFGQALRHLRAAVDLSAERPLSDLEQQGLIKIFELTYEVAWNTLKDFLTSRGVESLYGSRDAVRASVKAGLVTDGGLWMEMIQSRNLTAHVYDEQVMEAILHAVRDRYVRALEHAWTTLDRLREAAHREWEEP